MLQHSWWHLGSLKQWVVVHRTAFSTQQPDELKRKKPRLSCDKCGFFKFMVGSRGIEPRTPTVSILYESKL